MKNPIPSDFVGEINSLLCLLCLLEVTHGFATILVTRELVPLFAANSVVFSNHAIIKIIQEVSDISSKALHKISLHRLMDLKIDYAFKQLFGSEKNKDITVVF